jgi:uncharacterized protein YeaO (DUF488 family)
MTVAVKRIYEPASRSDGMRILVDRIWPRGMKKDESQLDLWLKDVAPTNSLRRWFDHRPERWEKFRERYLAELSDNAALKELGDLVKKRKRVTLLYSARDTAHNQAVVLADYLSKSRGRKPATGSRRSSSR